IHHQITDGTDAGRWVFTEDFAEDFVERLKITGVSEDHCHMYHIGQTVACVFHNLQAVVDRQTRLLNDTAFHHFAIHHGCLPRNRQPSTGCYRTGKRQMLSSGTDPTGGTETRDADNVSSHTAKLDVEREGVARAIYLPARCGLSWPSL